MTISAPLELNQNRRTSQQKLEWLLAGRRGVAVRLVAVVISVPLLVDTIFARNPPLGIYLNGVVIGSLYGLVAMGIVLVYRSNRIISFAQAELGAAPAVAGITLFTQRGWPYPVALFATIVLAVALGAAVEIFIVRRFAYAPRLILTVATIGIAQVLAYIEFMTPGWIGGPVLPTAAVRTPFSSHEREIGDVVFRGDHLVTLLVVALCAVALVWFLHRTSAGMGVRAAAENRDRALLSGVPVARVSTIVWMIATLLSALGVFFRAPLVGVPIGGLIGPGILLFAVAAAVVARLENLWIALGAGVVLGVFDQSVFYATRSPNLPSAVILPMVLIALLVQRRTLSRAEDGGASSWQAVRSFQPIPARLRALPEVRAGRLIGALALAALVLVTPVLAGTYHTNDASQVLIFALIGLSLVVLTGWAGQISLGQFAFTGVGAAVAGGFATKAGGDFFLALVLAGLAGAAFAVLVGLPAVRVQGLFLAVTTLAFASACYAYLLNRDYFGWLLPETGDVVERPKLYGLINVSSDRAYYYVCATTLGLAVLSVRSLRRSRAGRALCATRDNPKAAQAFGLSLARMRLMAFAVSGFLAAVAGGLYSYLTRSTDPDNFFPTRSIDVFAMGVIGGLGSIPGAIVGAVYVVGVKEFLPDYELLASGAGMLLLLLVAPGGLAELGYRARDRFVRWSARRHGMTDRDLAWGTSDVEPTAAYSMVDADDEPGLEEAELPALTGRGSS